MKVELLAPGGSYDSVLAAYNAGADAVYTAGLLFGARAGAENLTLEQLLDVIDYAHIHNKKLYLTVNTLLKDAEIENQLYDFLLPLYENGLDAVIVQDMGVILFIRRYFPQLPIHASTQMTIFGKGTVKELENLGVRRIVMPRELSLEEIRELSHCTTLELEGFVHGALCYCYSGQCFLSSYIGGRSGNRGRCAQPCRMEYDIIHQGKLLNPGNQKYVLSPKDICTLKILPDIITSGVYSLKIEGRMKKTEYVAGVVSIYRKYVDCYLNNPDTYAVEDRDIKLLSDLFQRNGFSESYYHRHNGADMISLRKPGFRTENKEFTNYLRETYLGRRLKRELSVCVKCVRNKPIEMYTTIEEMHVVVSGAIPSPAKSRPIGKESIIRQLTKTGNTDFRISHIEIDADENLFVPVGELNELRRQFLCRVKDTILSLHKRDAKQYRPDEFLRPNTTDIEINASVWNKEQLDIVLKSKIVKAIYIEIDGFDKQNIGQILCRIQNERKKACLALPFVFRRKEREILDKTYLKYVNQSDGVLIRNAEQYFYLLHNGVENYYIFDYNVYTNNRLSKQYYLSKGNIKTTAPLELNEKELKKRGLAGDELIVYGYMPAMISAGCGLKTCNSCQRNNDTYHIKDRLGNDFVTKCICESCYNIMYNCKALSLFKYADEIRKLNPDAVRLSFTTESRSQVKEILQEAEDALIKRKIIQEDDKTTRGHFKRGVL